MSFEFTAHTVSLEVVAGKKKDEQEKEDKVVHLQSKSFSNKSSLSLYRGSGRKTNNKAEGAHTCIQG
jgi:Fe-S cluster assembly scaffold protein SufB